MMSGFHRQPVLVSDATIQPPVCCHVELIPDRTRSVCCYFAHVELLHTTNTHVVIVVSSDNEPQYGVMPVTKHAETKSQTYLLQLHSADDIVTTWLRVVIQSLRK